MVVVVRDGCVCGGGTPQGGGGINPLHSMEYENNLVFLIW